MLDADAAVTISSQILNRQDGRDEYRSGVSEAPAGFDPRKAEQFIGERPLELWCGSRKIRSFPAATG